MLEVWRKRLNVSSLGLQHEAPVVFVCSQWQRKHEANAYYLGYRVLMTTYLVVAWVLSVVDAPNLSEPHSFHLKWLIYLTNWGFTFCVMQALLCTSMLVARFSVIWRGGPRADLDATSHLRLYKIYWVCFTISLDLSVAVTLLYWFVIYNPDTMLLDYVNIMVHCTNMAAMIVELAMVAHPVRLSHFYMPVTIGLTYTLFSLSYYVAGGTSRLNEPYIYSTVDWRKPISALCVCLGACVLLMVIHFGSYVFYRFRMAVANRLMVGDDDDVTIPAEKQFHGFDNCLGNDPV